MKDIDLYESDLKFFEEINQKMDIFPEENYKNDHFSDIKDLNEEYNQYEHGNFTLKRDNTKEKLKRNIFEISKLANNYKVPLLIKSFDEY